jgi:hypothetical protein
MPDRPCPHDSAHVVASIGGAHLGLDVVGGVPWDQFADEYLDQHLRERFRPEGLDGIQATAYLGTCADCGRLVVAVRMADRKRWTPEHGPAWTSPWTPLERDGEQHRLRAAAGERED